MSLELDYSELNSALLFVEKVTGRDCADSLNRAALHSIIGGKGIQGAMQLTPKAEKANIMKVTDAQLGAFVALRNRRQGVKMTPVEFRQAVKKERVRRLRAVGYIAFAGWNNAAVALGGRGLKKNADFTKSEAVHGSGKKATSFYLTAEATNTAPWAEEIGLEPLQRGINNAAKDLIEYGERKMQQRFDSAH